MDVKVIDQQAYYLMKRRFEKFAKEMAALCDPPRPNGWMDVQEVCQLLDASKRQLQYYRDNGIIPFSCIGKKSFYKPSDLKTLIENHYIKPSRNGNDRK